MKVPTLTGLVAGKEKAVGLALAAVQAYVNDPSVIADPAVRTLVAGLLLAAVAWVIPNSPVPDAVSRGLEAVRPRKRPPAA